MNFSAPTCFLHELLSPVDTHVFRAYAKATVNPTPKWHLYFISLCRRKNVILAVKHLTAFKLYYVFLTHTHTLTHISLKKIFKNYINHHQIFVLPHPRGLFSSFHYEHFIPQATLTLKQLFITNKVK